MFCRTMLCSETTGMRHLTPETMNTNEAKEQNGVKVAITTAGNTHPSVLGQVLTVSLVGVAGTTVLAP